MSDHVEALVRRGRCGIGIMGVSAIDVVVILPYSLATPDGRVECLTPFGWTAVDRLEAVRSTKPVSRTEAVRAVAGLKFEDAATGREVPVRLVTRINHRRMPR
jgi:hypothetical protein